MALQISNIHHIAIICSNYEVSKQFYTQILGFEIISENYRTDRNSMKCDLNLNGNYCLELFSFTNPPARITQPEACGLRHLALEVADISETHRYLAAHGYNPESIRKDEYTGKRFFFSFDPDNLPIEFYEI